MYRDVRYVMFDCRCSPLMQYNLSPACLLAPIQYDVTDGPFVSSNFFPLPCWTLTCLFSLSCFFFLSLTSITFMPYYFNVVFKFSFLFLHCPFLSQHLICSLLLFVFLLYLWLFTFLTSLNSSSSSVCLLCPCFLLFLVSLSSCSQNYFKDAWNIFDCVTVLGSITDILVTELGVSIRI